MLLFACQFPLAAEELTVAEQTDRETIAQIKKKFEETLKSTPTKVTGQAILPDGKPAVGFKIGGWGRSLTNQGYGHFLFDTVTDDTGHFSLDLYRPALYWIKIDDPNKVYAALDQYIELTESIEPMRFQLQKGIPIEGVVIDRDKNEPIAGLPIWLMHDPIPWSEMSREERIEYEKKTQNPREVKTDREGEFRFIALPLKYMVSFDSNVDMERSDEEAVALYTRTLTVANEPIQLEFKIPTPWQAQLLQKDGSPATFFPVNLFIRFTDGSAYPGTITDKEGRFMFYRPVRLESLHVDTFKQNQWFYQSFKEQELPPNPVFQLNTPLTAKGRLVRKSTGEPMRNFKFICDPAHNEVVTTDANGDFTISGIFLNRETDLGFVNPPDDDSCSIASVFKTFTPTEPDKLIDFGVIELEESGRLASGTLENLPGKVIEIEGVTLDGKPFDWSKYKDKVVLIEFWATWCSPCLAELPNLKTQYEKYHGKGFEIVGISVDEDLNALEKGLEKHQFPWTILADEKWKNNGHVKMYDRFSIRGVPRGLLIDRDGKVITIETRGEKLGAELKRLFGE